MTLIVASSDSSIEEKLLEFIILFNKITHNDIFIFIHLPLQKVILNIANK